jgi:arsenite/tail-anchored protein-transporting ATPase
MNDQKAPPDFHFFTGKGGVGKTSLACATAVQLAGEGARVLLVSTDPASNLQDVLESPVTETVARIDGTDGLYAINIDPEISAEHYRKRATAPLEGIASEAEIGKIREELSGACTTEIASFDEFSRFISGESDAGTYDVVIFDTAPTGHTLRLLELPAAWSSYTLAHPDGASCLGPTSALKSGQARYRRVVATLRDPERTTVHLVARADRSSLKEAARTSNELKELGMANQQLMVNGVFKAIDPSDAIARQMEQLAAGQLSDLPEALKDLPVRTFPLLPYNILGLEKLRSLLDPELQERVVTRTLRKEKEHRRSLPGLDELVRKLSDGQDHGLIMTMGKGGVGKTIAASAIAVMLANEGHEVLLTTTDPAAHIQDFIGQLEKLPPTLTIERIDPKLETGRYTGKILESRGRDLDDQGRKLLLEDLRSPCTEEVAVFHAFSRAIGHARRKFVVIDTAPTGHTLLLLDTTGSYHREIMRNNTMPGRVRTPYMALQDRELAKILMISLPETTPMHEAATLQRDLERAGITPYAWVINQCLSMLDELKDPLLCGRAQAEHAVIETIRTTHAERTFGIPYIAEKELLPALLGSAAGILNSGIDG